MERLKKISSASATVLAGKNMNSMNTFDKPDAVCSKTCDVKINGNSVEVVLAPRSVLALTVK